MEKTGNRHIIITGPESTGKTTICEALASKFNGICMPEFSRTYISGLNRPYTIDDIKLIATKQNEQYNSIVAGSSSKICFFDTYLIITKIWMIWHASRYDDWIDNAIANTKDALWLLCVPDIEWKADSVRENGGEARLRLFELYKNELEKFKLNYKLVSGIGEKRILNAESFVTSYIENQ